MKSRILISVIIMAAVFSACAKAPETVSRAQMKIDLSIIENKEVYVVTFGGLLENVNKDTAFLGIKGVVELFDPASKKTAALFEFSLPEILPFTSSQSVPFGYSNLVVKKNFTEKEVAPLLELFEIEKEKLVGNKEGQAVRVDEKNIRFKSLEYEKKNIITLLKEKI